MKQQQQPPHAHACPPR
uniref:Uncharacterized protein n=1 Tax=Arundo donax TaxID=35708 RepID=A0A0A9CYM4_ARUDO